LDQISLFKDDMDYYLYLDKEENSLNKQGDKNLAYVNIKNALLHLLKFIIELPNII
jgi:hypothetical protein